MIRIFRFKNNFLSDEPQKLMADYTVLGYFDALDTFTIEKDEELADTDKLLFRNLGNEYEKCDYYHIIGFREDDDSNFWQYEDKPLVFISCVRLKKRTKYLKNIVAEIEKDIAVCYYTYNSSDIIICTRSSDYKAGYLEIKKYFDIVKRLDSENALQKSFSVLAIRQSILNKIEYPQSVLNKSKEKVSCILRCVNRNRDKINAFKEQLCIECNISRCESFAILGSDDLIIFLKDVFLRDLLKLYRDNGLLTHWNVYYKNAFYNIRTEILTDWKEVCS